jgi:hypothetical protein
LRELPFGCHGVYMVLWRPHANESAQSLKIIQILPDIDGR